MFLTKYEYFMYFLVSRFFTWFFADSGPVHILGFAGSMTGTVPITLADSPLKEIASRSEVDQASL